MKTNKESAVEFMQMIIAGDIDAAYEKYVDMKGRHHNVHTPAGFEALKKGMKESHETFPNKEFTIQHVIGEDDLVAVHSHLVLQKGAVELMLVHLLRFENAKIVEMWDIAQQTPTDSGNGV